MCQFAESHDGTYRRYKGVVFTIVDCNEYTDKAGVKQSMQRKLLVAKKGVAERLKLRYQSCLERGHGLRGAMFKVHRTNDAKSSAVGDDFEYHSNIDLNSLPESQELDYAELLSPSVDKMNAWVHRITQELGGGVAPTGGATGPGVQY
jgi:hypothetical protein